MTGTAKVKSPKATAASDTGPPVASELARLLGVAYAAYRTLTTRRDVSSEWRRYARSAPWVLKVRRGDRTLFYVRPARDSFEVTVVLGARATEAALRGGVSKRLHAAIRAGRPYAEGRPVRVVVRREADLVGVEELVAVKLDPGTGLRNAAHGMRARKGAGGPTRS